LFSFHQPHVFSSFQRLALYGREYREVFVRTTELIYDLYMTKHKLDIALHLAEINLDSPVEPSYIPVPGEVELDGDRLVWRGVVAGMERTEYSNKDLLDRFITLADADKRQILSYARKWGVLHICEHGLPASHNPQHFGLSPEQTIEQCAPLGWPEIPERFGIPENEEDMEQLFSGWEPIDSWRSYSRDAQAILNIAAAIYNRKPREREDWERLAENADALVQADVSTQQKYLVQAVKRWLVAGNVRPDIVLTSVGRSKSNSVSEPRITLGGYGPAWGHLFGALACQLMYAITRAKGLAFCDGCGNTSVPARRPRTDRRNFCKLCQKRGEAIRLASADYRERKAREKLKR
jgi:hypothetical protein